MVQNNNRVSNPGDALRKKYSRIVANHPKEKNLMLVDKIYELLKSTSSDKKKTVYLSALEISKQMPEENTRIVRRCVSKLDEADYLNKYRNGARFIYFATEDSNGNFESIFDRDEAKDKQKKSFDAVVAYLETNSSLLDEELVKELERVRVSRNSDRPNYEAHNVLVQVAWNNGNTTLHKISLRSSAYRYAVK